MNGLSREPFITIPLRDGVTASVDDNAIHVGERAYALSDVQDARQVAPDPETLALRVANERTVVELQPARPGDGSLLLEAIFRLKPSLRPAGFDAPMSVPASFPPLSAAPAEQAASWGVTVPASPVPNNYGPYNPYSPPPVNYAPPARQIYGRSDLSGGRLMPTPRTAGELIGATFDLFLAHWKQWLLLGFVALFVPEIIRGSVDALFQVLGGGDLWAGLAASSNAASADLGVTGRGLLSSSDLLFAGLNLLVGAAVGALVGGWAAAVLGNAGRDALFGHAPAIGGSMRAGLRRLLPAMGASILSVLLPLLILTPVLVLYGILITQFGSAIADPNTLDPTSPAATAFAGLGCLSLVLLVPCGLLWIYVNVRLTLAPYIAATEPLGPLAALRKSWNLTRRQWWHTFGPIVAIGVVAVIIMLPFNFAEYVTFGGAALFLIPLVQALTAPLVSLAAVEVLYDLRLRREGYATLQTEEQPRDEPAPSSV